MASPHKKRKSTRQQFASKPSENGSTNGNAVHVNGTQEVQGNAAPPVWQVAVQAIADDGRPIIYLSHEEKVVNDLAAKALANDPDLFQRGGFLVSVLEDQAPAVEATRKRLRPRIRIIKQATLREILSERIAFRKGLVKQNGENGGSELQGAHPPAHTVQALHSRGRWDSIRHLEGVVDYPVFTAKGTVLCQPGYDAETGLLQTYKGEALSIPDNPTPNDVKTALSRLRHAFVDFPFEHEMYWSGFLAAALSLLARYAYDGPTPLFLVDANVRSAGKGMLLNCLGRIVVGRDMAVTPCPKDQDNLEKLITSIVMGGFQYILFDNLSGKFGNGVLDMALTSTEWQTRILGGNEIMLCPLKLVWFATGNNVQLEGDMSRRVQHIRLYSTLEHPENRDDFTHPDILAFCKEHRAELLSHLLTLLVAYHRAGKPKQKLIPWGSFEGFSSLIRATLVWAGLPDPALALRPLQEKTDEEAGHLAKLAEIWERFDPQHDGVTAKEFIGEVNIPTPRMPSEDGETAKQIMEELLKETNARQLGEKLKKYQGRNFGGRIFVQVRKDRKGYALWASKPVQAYQQRAESTRLARQNRQQIPNLAESAEPAESISPTANCREPGEEG